MNCGVRVGCWLFTNKSLCTLAKVASEKVAIDLWTFLSYFLFIGDQKIILLDFDNSVVYNNRGDENES